MHKFTGKKALVTGASQGLGRAIAKELAAGGTGVVAVARNRQLLETLQEEVNGEVQVEVADVSDESVASSLLERYRPELLVLAAGATPRMAPIHEQTWAQFNAVWDNDVKQTFHFGVAALRHLPPQSRVLILSSGAGLGGSPWSGSYAGAKRMQMFLCDYLKGVAQKSGKDIVFQCLVPKQMIGDTALGHVAASGYASALGITKDKFLERFGTPLTPTLLAERAVAILVGSAMAGVTQIAVTGEGLASLD